MQFQQHFLKTADKNLRKRKGREKAVWGVWEKQRTTGLCSHFRGTSPLPHPRPVTPAHGCSAKSHREKSSV